MRILMLYVFILLFPIAVKAQFFEWISVTPQVESSFRALSVVDDSVAWVGGTNGWIGKTTDGGKTWHFSQVKGFEKNDFRSLYAFDKHNALIANVASPANILRTTNGGKDWKIVYTNVDTSAFIDGIDFWNTREGVVYGDPIQNKMLLLRTKDGGLTWQEASDRERPLLKNGEASFAASGTNIRCVGKNELYIATGGLSSRLWCSSDKGVTWKTIEPPIIQGQSSRGIFSVALMGKNAVIVGGDYLIDSLRQDHVLVTNDAGKTWQYPNVPSRGYRECVEYISDNLLLSAGPKGIDLSNDGGKNWKAESDETSYHVVRKARNGNAIMLAGGKGKIAVLKKK